MATPQLKRLPTLGLTLTLVLTLCHLTRSQDSVCNFDVEDTGNRGRGVYFFDNFFIYALVSSNTSEDRYSLYYSQVGQRAVMTQYLNGTAERTYVLASANQFFTTYDSKTCTDEPLDGSDIAKFLHVNDLKDGYTMGPPNDPMMWKTWGVDQKLKFIGDATLAFRLLPVKTWQSCTKLVLPRKNLTLFTTWSFSNPETSQMPGQVDPSVPVLVTTEDVIFDESDKTTRNMRRDYTRYTLGVSPDSDPHYELPPSLLCTNRPSVYFKKALPSLPNTFQMVMQEVVTNQGQKRIVHSKVTSIHGLQIFIRETHESGSGDAQGLVELTRTVTDFITGIEFQMDITTGSCNKGPISTSNRDAISTSASVVAMRTVNQFFYLENQQYQYTGVHRHLDRQITSDVFSAQFDDSQQLYPHNTLVTWYFASQQWMKSQKLPTTIALPVMLDLTMESGEKRTTQIFEFTTLETQDPGIPDVSQCFDSTQELNIQLLFDGRYDKLVSPAPYVFSDALRLYLLDATLMLTYIRIAELRVDPAPKNQIAVQFKLLDISSLNIKGDVAKPAAMVPSAKVYSNLQSYVNTGAPLKVAGYAGNSGYVIVPVVKNSVSLLTAGNLRLAYKLPPNQGFGPGVMAGIAIGLLVAGLLMGALGIFLFRKFSNRSISEPMSMNKLASSMDS